jgi:hypothetical protein
VACGLRHGVLVVPHTARDVSRGDGVSRDGRPARAPHHPRGPGQVSTVVSREQGRAHHLPGVQGLDGHPAQAGHAAQHLQLSGHAQPLYW